MSNAKQPYIFISYAHRDKELIYPFISALKEKYEVWFDEGIHYGREWEEEIAAKLNGCSIFIYAITENSLNSENCKDELYHARNKSKNFLNVLFSEDVVLPEWFEFRYGRYQMCYYNRFPSAQAVVEDLGQKCEWFEDVKLQTVQNAGGSYGLNSEEPNGVSFKDIIKAAEPFSEIIEEKQRGINSEREKKEKSEADNSSDKRRFTREQIIEAIEYAKKADEERRPFYNLRHYIKWYKDLTDSHIKDAIKSCPNEISKDNIVAMYVDPLYNRGGLSFLITEDRLYYTDFLSSKDPLVLSKVKSVKFCSGAHIEITYIDSTYERRAYGEYAPIVYDFLVKLIDQKPGAPTKINIV